MAFFKTVIGAIAVAAAEAQQNGVVPLLTSANFDTFIAENPVTLIKFMAPWCGHCKKLAPEFEAAAEQLKKDGGVPLAEVDASAEQALAQRFGIQGFPTMFLFRNGVHEPYSGGRTADTIVSWVKQMTGPAVTWTSTAADVSGDEAVRFVSAVHAKSDEAAVVLSGVADVSRTKGSFYAHVDKSVPANSVKITVERRGESPVTRTFKHDEKKEIAAFVEEEYVPLFGKVSGENYSSYATRSDKWVWFAGNQEQFDKIAPEVRKASQSYRNEFNFVWLDVSTHKQHAEHMLGLKETPGIAVMLKESKYHYVDPIEKITSKSLGKFIEKVKAGKVERSIKSEAIPATNDEPVKVVVGKNFSEMVLQDDKDVFLKIYAPWCGHCKSLAPEWESLAESLEGDKNIVIAKFDGTANEPDVPGFEYRGFPTLYFVKAGSKTPIPYDGERTQEAMLEFIKANASHDVPAGKSTREGDKDEL